MLPSVSLADSNPSQYPITPTQKLNLDSDLSSLLKGGTVISSLASTTSLHKRPKTPLLVTEVLALRSQYLENGGNDAKILNQLALLEEEAKLLEERNVERPATKDVDAGTCQMNYGTYPMYTTESEDESRLKIQPYSQDVGLLVLWDFISGIPNTPTSSIEITYGIIDRENPVFFLSTFKSRGKFRSTLFSNVYVLAHSSQEKNAQPKRSMQMVIQIRLLRRKDTVDLYDLRPFAWTSVDLFSADKLLNAGKWKLPIFLPPVDFLENTKSSNNLSRLPGAFLCMRLYSQLIGDVRLTRHPEIIDDYESFSSEFESIQPLSPVSPEATEAPPPRKDDRQYATDAGDTPRKYTYGEIETGDYLTANRGRSNVVNPMTGEENRVEAQLLIEEFQNYIPLPSFFIKIRIVTSNGMDLQPLWMSDALAGLDAKGLVKWKTLNVITELMTSDFSIGFRLVVEICQAGDELVIAGGSTGIVTGKGVYTLSLICNDISAASISFRIKAVDLAAQPSEEVPAAETLVDPWLESKYERTKNVKATRGDVMTLYIDGARFLPQNCTISRAISKVFSRDLKEAEGCEPVETCPTLDSPIFSPTFQMLSKEMKPHQADATLVALIKLYTIDKHTSQIALIGVSLLNLYKDATSNEQPSEKALTNAVVNEGNFQLPVYIPPKDYEFPDGLHVKCLSKRLPCCTLLVRLYHGKSNESPPLYTSKLYNSVSSTPTPTDLLLYPVISSYASPTLRAHLQTLKDAPQSDDALTSYIVKRLTRDRSSVRHLDLSTAVKFDHTCAVAVDQAWNLKLKAFTVPVVKICEVRDGTKGLEMGVLGVKVAGKVNFEAGVRCPEWGDGFMIFDNIKPATAITNLYILIDIQSLTYSNKAYELKSQGWTLLPLTHHQEYLIHGSYQIPLYDGSPTPALLSLLQKKSFNDAVFAATKNKALRINKKGGSVLIRVCDQRLTGDLKAGVDIDTSNLPNGDFLNYLESPPLRKLIPKGVTEENFRERCVATITQLTKEKE